MIVFESLFDNFEASVIFATLVQYRKSAWA